MQIHPVPFCRILAYAEIRRTDGLERKHMCVCVCVSVCGCEETDPDIFTDLHDFVEGRPVSEVPLHELISNTPFAAPHNVQTTLDRPFSRFGVFYPGSSGALPVGASDRVEDKPGDEVLFQKLTTSECLEQVSLLIHNDHASPVPRPERLHLGINVLVQNSYQLNAHRIKNWLPSIQLMSLRPTHHAPGPTQTYSHAHRAFRLRITCTRTVSNPLS